MPRFRPMALGDIFDEAFDLYKKNFLFLLLVTAVVVVPLQVLAPLLALRFPQRAEPRVPASQQLRRTGAGGSLRSLGPFFSRPGDLRAAVSPAAAVEIVALAGACSACYLGEPLRLWTFYRVPLRRFLPLVFTALLYASC